MDFNKIKREIGANKRIGLFRWKDLPIDKNLSKLLNFYKGCDII